MDMPNTNPQTTTLEALEEKFVLLGYLHKPVRDFVGRVAIVRCCLFTLPALLSAESYEHPRIGEITPASNALVHNLIDLPDFPLFRLVKSVVQGFLVELLGADPVSYTHLGGAGGAVPGVHDRYLR